MIRETSSVKNEIRYYSSLIAKQMSWLWEPYIPYGKITIIQGDPGDGKTTSSLISLRCFRGDYLCRSLAS